MVSDFIRDCTTQCKSLIFSPQAVLGSLSFECRPAAKSGPGPPPQAGLTYHFLSFSGGGLGLLAGLIERLRTFCPSTFLNEKGEPPHSYERWPARRGHAVDESPLASLRRQRRCATLQPLRNRNRILGRLAPATRLLRVCFGEVRSREVKNGRWSARMATSGRNGAGRRPGVGAIWRLGAEGANCAILVGALRWQNSDL